MVHNNMPRDTNIDLVNSSTSDDPYARLGVLVQHVARRLSSALQQSDLSGLRRTPYTPNEATVLIYLDEHPGASPSAIAEHTGIQRANVSTVLRRLEEAGEIQRRADPDDGRRSRLTVEPAASDRIRAVNAYWSGLLESSLEQSPDLAHQLTQAVQLLEAANRKLAALEADS